MALIIERVALVLVTPAVLLAAINACAADRQGIAREPELLPPPPNLCAILARLARGAGEVTFVPRASEGERVAEQHRIAVCGERAHRRTATLRR